MVLGYYKYYKNSKMTFCLEYNTVFHIFIRYRYIYTALNA